MKGGVYRRHEPNYFARINNTVNHNHKKRRPYDKKKKFNPKVTRRQVLKAGMIGGAGLMLPLRFLPAKAFANNCVPGGACNRLGGAVEGCYNFNLSDPCIQPKFENAVPNALDPSFIFQSPNNKYKIAMQPQTQMTGLVDGMGNPLTTAVWGYGKNGPGGTWPGMTIVAQSGV
ncbi:MAG: hypothetical protein PVG17_15815, partial [Desulfobacterales bacterium]